MQLGGHTVVDTFGDRLKNFDIKRSSTTVVPIVLVFVVTDDTLRPFRSCDLNGGRLGYPGNNLMGIERGNGWVRIDGVRVENFRKVNGFEDWLEEVCNERIFIWTTDDIDGTSAPTAIFRATNLVLTWHTSAPLLEKPIITYRRDQQDERGRGAGMSQ